MIASLILIFFLLVFTPLARGTIAPWASCIVHITCLGILLSLFIHNIRRKGNIKGRPKIDWRKFRTPLDLPFLFFLVLAILSVVFSTDYKKSIFELFKIIDYLIIYYLVASSCNSRKEINLYIYPIIGIGFFLSVWGVIQYIGGADHSWWLSANKLSGPFSNYNYFAGYLAIIFLLGLGVMFTRLETVQKIPLGYALTMMAVAFILTMCRVGWASMFFTLVVMGMLHVLKAIKYTDGDKQRAISLRLVAVTAGPIFITAALGIGLLGFKPLSDRAYSLFDPKNKSERSTLNTRTPIWKATLKIVKNYPLTGAGLGTFPKIHTKYMKKRKDYDRYVWNEYLQIAMEAGIPASMVFLWLIVSLLVRCAQIYLRAESKFKQGISIGIFGGILATALHSFTAPLLHFMSHCILLAILAGIAMSMSMSMSMEQKKKTGSNLQYTFKHTASR